MVFDYTNKSRQEMKPRLENPAGTIWLGLNLDIISVGS